jgi:hypothetical protein
LDKVGFLHRASEYDMLQSRDASKCAFSIHTPGKSNLRIEPSGALSVHYMAYGFDEGNCAAVWHAVPGGYHDELAAWCRQHAPKHGTTPALERTCDAHGLENARHAGFPVYTYIQRPGCLVLMPPGVHYQVAYKECTTCSLSWTVCLPHGLHAFIKDIVPQYHRAAVEDPFRMTQLIVNTVKRWTSVKPTDNNHWMADWFRRVLLAYQQLMQDEASELDADENVPFTWDEQFETTHQADTVCSHCRYIIFNRYKACDQCNMVRCLHCVAKGFGCAQRHALSPRQHWTRETLRGWYVAGCAALWEWAKIPGLMQPVHVKQLVTWRYGTKRSLGTVVHLQQLLSFVCVQMGVRWGRERAARAHKQPQSCATYAQAPFVTLAACPSTRHSP